MVTEEDRILISQYLDGSLPSNELSILRARLKEEEALQQSLDRERELRDWIGQKKQVDDTMAYLRGLTDQKATTTTAGPKPVDKPVAAVERNLKRRRRSLLMAAISAAVFFLVAASLWWLVPLNEGLVEHRPLAKEMGDDASAAIRAFNAGNYSDALPLLVSINKPKSEVQLATAISFIETGRPEEALPLLDQLRDNSPNHADAANFYAGLANYRNDRPTLARIRLEKVAAESYYYPAAKRLLKKL